MQRNCAGIFYRNVCSRAIRFYMGIYFMQSQSRSLRICVSTHFAKESESATNFQKRIRETNVIVWRAWWYIIIIIICRYSYCARRSNFICTCCKVYTHKRYVLTHKSRDHNRLLHPSINPESQRWRTFVQAVLCEWWLHRQHTHTHRRLHYSVGHRVVYMHYH